MNKKYEFTGQTFKSQGIEFRRIKRISDGKIGGWIQSEDNLSQEGFCFVYGDALVYDRAKVSGDAKVSGNSQIFGDAKVYGNAEVYGDAEVCDTVVFCGFIY